MVVAPEPSPRGTVGVAVDRAMRLVITTNEVLVVMAIAFDLFLTFGNTLERYFLSIQIYWLQDFTTVALNLVAFLGGAAAFGRERGLSFTYVVDRLPTRWRPIPKATATWTCVFVASVVLSTMPTFLHNSQEQQLSALPGGGGVVAVWMALGYGLIVFYCLIHLSKLPARAVGGGAAIAALILGLLVGFRLVQSDIAIDPAIPAAVIMALAFIAGVPIAFVLTVTALTLIYLLGNVPILTLPAAFQLGISSFVLVAVPFFMVAGVLMTVTGMAKRLVDLVAAWVSQWRGGLLIGAVASMYVFSGMSGSKLADIAAVGAVMREPLRDRGFPESESVAVLSAAGAMGETIPPSITMLILASITTVSIGSLFLAGLVPALVMALVIVAAILLRGGGGRLPLGTQFNLGVALRAAPAALPALLMPVIIVGGIVGGVGTATEVSSFAVVYGLAIAALLYRSLDLARLWVVLREAAVMAGTVLLILATASLLSEAVTFDGLPALIVAAISAVGGRIGFLILSALALVVMGSFLEGIVAIILFAPILLPAATQLGIDPLHFSIVLIMAMGIGQFAPPIGIGLYFTCAVLHVAPARAFRPALFYTMALLVGLAFLIALPVLATGVPAALGHH
jgi:C4-dicarboxylate transporter DctM subunit